MKYRLGAFILLAMWLVAANPSFAAAEGDNTSLRRCPAKEDKALKGEDILEAWRGSIGADKVTVRKEAIIDLMVQGILSAGLSRHLWFEGQAPAQFFTLNLSSAILHMAREKERRASDGDKEKRYLLQIAPEWISALLEFTEIYMPPLGILHKWPGDITVGVSWPLYDSMTDYDDAKYKIMADNRSRFSRMTDVQYGKIRNIVEPLLPEMRQLTGRNVTFVPKGDPREKTAEFARLRIVLTTYSYHLKRPRLGLGNMHSHTVEDYQGYFTSAVNFTPDSRAQVDGFFLTDDKDDIRFAVCYVNPDVGEVLLKALIQECLVRAMGLPEFQGIEEGSILANWNSDFEPPSDFAQDFNKEFMPRYVKGLPHAKGNPFPVEFVDERKIPKGLSDYDRGLLRALYCDALQSGMDARRIIEEISIKCNTCFSFLDTAEVQP
ncbi:MAG TPA: hypothetical protein VHP34_06340 [Alphaproteobacteria bacterium]|nr:hypothetical protein [Alphaproteobacteria bacterium]